MTAYRFLIKDDNYYSFPEFEKINVNDYIYNLRINQEKILIKKQLDKLLLIYDTVFLFCESNSQFYFMISKNGKLGIINKEHIFIPIIYNSIVKSSDEFICKTDTEIDRYCIAGNWIYKCNYVKSVYVPSDKLMNDSREYLKTPIE